MNYLKMVKFKSISSMDCVSTFLYKDNEDINFFDQSMLVPCYMILEGIFQTAGKLAREYTNNVNGAYVVSFSNFSFARPIFNYEELEIRSHLESYNSINKCFFLSISLYQDEEIIIKNGQIILKQDQNIKNDYLNNDFITTKEMNLKTLGY